MHVVARRQSGVLSIAQLCSLGFSIDEIKQMVARGHLIRIYRGVYAVGHTALTDRARLIAALLTAPDTAFLSHFTAAGVYGIDRLHLNRIHLTIPGAGRRPRHPGITVHRTRHDPHPDEVRRRDGLAVSSVHRLCVELAPLTTQRHLETLITEAVRRELFNTNEMEATLARHARQKGLVTLKRSLRGYRPPVASGWEAEFAVWLLSDPRVPPPETDVHVLGWELDFHWPQLRFAIELDGERWHRSVFDVAKDNRKDIDLQKHGIRVMRVTEERWHSDRPGIRRDAYAFLGIA